MSEGNVVGFDTFRSKREKSIDEQLAEVMERYSLRPTHIVWTRADLIAFAKTGGPPPLD